MTAAGFWRRVGWSGDPNDCMFWRGGRTGAGYGSVLWKGKATLAHRLVYTKLVGPIPNDKVLDHVCRETTCVNPDHLEAVTQRENLRRGLGFSGRNARKAACPKGHPYDQENTYDYRGWRYCKICMKQRTARSRERKALCG